MLQPNPESSEIMISRYNYVYVFLSKTQQLKMPYMKYTWTKKTALKRHMDGLAWCDHFFMDCDFWNQF
jgi:hypothetical protein